MNNSHTNRPVIPGNTPGGRLRHAAALPLLLTALGTAPAHAAAGTPVVIDSEPFSYTSPARITPQGIAGLGTGTSSLAWTVTSADTYVTTPYLALADSSGTITQGPIALPQAPAMAPSGDGGAVLAWNAVTYGAANQVTNTVYYQRMDANGVLQGTPVQVHTDTLTNVPSSLLWYFNYSFLSPQVAVAADGRIAVAWSELLTAGFICPWGENTCGYRDQSSKSYAALYDADGSVAVAARVVDSVPLRSTQIQPISQYNGNFDGVYGLGFQPAGDLVIASDRRRGPNDAMLLAELDSGLNAAGSAFTLSGVTFSSAYAPDFGIDAQGRFDVAWYDPSDASIRVSRYDAAWNPIGQIGPVDSQVGICSSTADIQISVAPAGDFAVTWGNCQSDPTGLDVTLSYRKSAQFFNADGSANGAPVLVSDVGSQPNITNSKVAYTGPGTLLESWVLLSADQTTQYLVDQTVVAP